MKKLTYQQLQKKFDKIISEVENGKSFIIDYMGTEFALIPYNTYKKCNTIIDEYSKLYIENNNEAS